MRLSCATAPNVGHGATDVDGSCDKSISAFCSPPPALTPVCSLCALQVGSGLRPCLSPISFLTWTVVLDDTYSRDSRLAERPGRQTGSDGASGCRLATRAESSPRSCEWRTCKQSTGKVARNGKEVKAWRRPAPPFPSSGTRRPTLRLLRRKGPFVSATTGDNGWCCFRTQPTSPRSERPSLSLSRSWLLSLRSETRN